MLLKLLVRTGLLALGLWCVNFILYDLHNSLTKGFYRERASVKFYSDINLFCFDYFSGSFNYVSPVLSAIILVAFFIYEYYYFEDNGSIFNLAKSDFSFMYKLCTVIVFAYLLFDLLFLIVVEIIFYLSGK